MEKATLSKVRWSIWSLNSVNFFLAQIADVVVPFLTVFLKQHNWNYEQIGVAMAVTTFGSVAFQIPAGVICGRIRFPRYLLAAWAMALGGCYFLIPVFVDHKISIGMILFLTGIAGTFFAPLLGSLAWLIAGQKDLDYVVGRNRSWNHAGNVAAGLVTLLVVRSQGLQSLFYVAALASIVSAISALMIRKKDLHHPRQSGNAPVFSWSMFKEMFQLLKNHQVVIVLTSVALFHFANGPTNTLVALYMKQLGSTDDKIAWIALVSQPIMIPAAWLAGKYCAEIGRKPVMAIAFLLLPVRIFLYILASTPVAVLAITAMDGIIAGVFGVMAILLSNDLSKGQRGFNSLLGLFATMPAIGAMTGSLIQGYLTEHYGFSLTFSFFGFVALAAALFFLFTVRETKK